jgi:hypothetical protein
MDVSSSIIRFSFSDMIKPEEKTREWEIKEKTQNVANFKRNRNYLKETYLRKEGEHRPSYDRNGAVFHLSLRSWNLS